MLTAALLLAGCFRFPSSNSISGTVSIVGHDYCGMPSPQVFAAAWLPFDAEELVVRFRSGVDVGRVLALVAELGLELVRYNEVLDAYIVRAPSRMELQQAYEALQRHSAVRAVEPNKVFYGLGVVPSDPEYERQRWHYELANVPAAWAAGYTGGEVVVAVLDGGFELEHPDLKDRWYRPYDAFLLREGPFGDDGPSTALAHGTHVAGIIGAVANNGIGGAGVAWNVRLMPVRVLRWQNGSYTGKLEVIATGLRWAVDNGAHIVNMSLGTDASLATGSAVLAAELERAYSKGVTVIAAAGNSASTVPYFPACDPHVVAVGAVKAAGPGASILERSPESGYGPAITLFAPGGDSGAQVWSANRTYGQQYAGAHGTSMAAAHVSGVAALLHAAGVRGPERIKAALCLGASRGPAPSHYDPDVYGPCGFLDAYGALSVAHPPGAEDVRVLVGRREGSAFRVQDETRARPEGGFTLRGIPSGQWEVLAWVPRSDEDEVRPGDLLGRASVYVSGGAVGGQRLVLEPVPAGTEPLRIQR
ncbi:MAG TPA: S8 family serine peptidase [Limnochordales bacterium]